MASRRSSIHPELVDRMIAPIVRFLRIQASAGILLLACTIAALAWANSPWRESYDHFWHTDLNVAFGPYSLKMSLAHFVNDALMAIFFFVVGLEIKRELLVGELASFRKAAMPAVAALGGMAVPALVYTAVHFLTDAEHPEAMRGWAVPTATDIAFAVGILAILGSRVPLALKVFLTALAIVDDLGAVVVIAIFYTEHIDTITLLFAHVVLAASLICNWIGVRTPIVYALLGVVMWLLLLQSGVHATIGGVLLALTIPARRRIHGAEFAAFARRAIQDFERAEAGPGDTMVSHERQDIVHHIERACEQVQSPQMRIEHALHPWVAFVIMPIFALANAGVPFDAPLGQTLGGGVGLAVALGLLIGKPVGIVGATWIAARTGLGILPSGSSWLQILGVACLGGIGFTMSLFIAQLAFNEVQTLNLAKTGILAGSFTSGVLGSILLLRAPSRR